MKECGKTALRAYVMELEQGPKEQGLVAAIEHFMLLERARELLERLG